MFNKSCRKGRLRKLLLLLLFTLCASMGWSQKFSLGIKGGALLTWPGFGDKEAKDDFGRKVKYGFSTGVLINFPLKNEYDLVLEGSYSQRVRTLTFNDNQWHNNTTFQMMDMTMLLRKSFTFMLRENMPAEFFVNVGPEINYWFNIKGNIDAGGKPNRYEIKLNEDPTGNFHYMYLHDVNRWLFDIALGAGLQTPIKRNHHLITELRFISGHTFLGGKDSAYINILGFEDTFKTNLKTVLLSVAYTVNIDLKELKKGKSTIKQKSKN